jgi:hypothetical protein
MVTGCLLCLFDKGDVRKSAGGSSGHTAMIPSLFRRGTKFYMVLSELGSSQGDGSVFDRKFLSKEIVNLLLVLLKCFVLQFWLVG